MAHADDCFRNRVTSILLSVWLPASFAVISYALGHFLLLWWREAQAYFIRDKDGGSPHSVVFHTHLPTQMMIPQFHSILTDDREVIAFHRGAPSVRDVGESAKASVPDIPRGVLWLDIRRSEPTHSSSLSLYDGETFFCRLVISFYFIVVSECSTSKGGDNADT